MLQAIELLNKFKEHEGARSSLNGLDFETIFKMCAIGTDCAPLEGISFSQGCTGSNQAATESIILDIMEFMRGGLHSGYRVSNQHCGLLCGKLLTAEGDTNVHEKLSLTEPGDVVSHIEKYLGIGEDPEELNGSEAHKEGSAEGLHSYKEKADLKDSASDVEPESKVTAEDSETKENEVNEEVKKSKENSVSELDAKILRFYSAYYAGVVENLKKKYTAMFSSGFDVNTPDGLLTSEGIVGLSGSERKCKVFSIVTSNMYSIFKSKMNFTEMPLRSLDDISNEIMNGHKGSKPLLYFPNRFLEIAFGREISQKRRSDKTYQKHANSANWSTYRDSHVHAALDSQLASLTTLFVHELMEQGLGEDDIFNASVANQLSDFLNYAELCLSTCLLVMDYKSRQEGYIEKVSTLKIRVCDPLNALGSANICEEIIDKAFLGNNGDVPFTYEPRIEPEVMVKEYAHDFNRDEALAMPMFAYKALVKLKEQGKELSWKGLILGMYSDGSILRNGTHGIDLLKEISHHIIAGSRAGKGVMTLNLVASGIASKKPTFYFDDKPDMASLFRSLSKSMFVVNGNLLQQNDDHYGQFPEAAMNAKLSQVPDYVLEAFGASRSWADLGSVVYIRALSLVVGILEARASFSHPPAELNGDEGILVVVDEIERLQSHFKEVLNQLHKNIPPFESVYQDALTKYKNATTRIEQKKAEGKDYLNDVASQEAAKCVLDNAFNAKTSYALAYAKSLAKSMTFIDSKRDAGFNEVENGRSDIFTISQDCVFHSCDASVYSSLLESPDGRFKSEGSFGVKGLSKAEMGAAEKGSVLFNLVSPKRCDAFFGRNDGSTRSKYLAMTVDGSPAKGKLDDKASNFAYIENYSADTIRKITQGSVQDNIAVAKSAKYFKPFLILNEGGMNSPYVEQMINRCQRGGVSREQLLAENPSPSGAPDTLHEAIGFLEYIKLAGCTDVDQVLAKSGEIANYTVKAMGYPGTWEDFIVDFSPKWIFTVEDVTFALQGKEMPMSNPQTNPVTKESAEYCPQLFGLGASDEVVGEEPIDCEDLEDEDAHDIRQKERFNAMFEALQREKELNALEREEEARARETAEQPKVYEEDEVIEIDFDDDEDGYEDDYEDDFVEAIHDSQISETGFDDFEFNEEDGQVPELDERFIEEPNGYEIAKALDNMKVKKPERTELGSLLSFLQSNGISLEVGENGWQFSRDLPKDDEWMRNSTRDGYVNHNQVSNFDGEFKYRGEVETLGDLIKIVSNDIIRMFGGFDNICSFKVIGGAIIVNGYYYKCKASQMFVREMPYDVRRQLQSGNISRLFDYGLLSRCRRLRDLEFDSVSFVYDYVSTALGYGSQISIDRFFNDFHALQVFTLGRKRFRRATYLQQIQDNDEFYHPRRITRIANASEGVLRSAGANSWNFSKRMARSKDYGTAVKVVGVVAGVGGAAAATAAVASSKVGRSAWRGIKGIAGGLQSAMRDTNNLK